MQEQRLLERIQAWEKDPTRRAKMDSRIMVDSVLGHLQRILNTRRGSVQIADDYGMPDFTGLMRDLSESLREIEKAVRHTIQKYEPRLTNVRINFIPHEDDLLALSFQITARLLTEDDRVPILFETRVASDGKISVKR